MSISTQYQNFSNVKILTILLSITLVSVGLTLYTVDFSINPNGDNFHYALHAIEYANGDFFISSKSNPGWSLFLSPFTLLIDSNDLTDYVNLSRILTIIIGSVTIFVFYGLARKFFNIKYSITAASLFAFEPHLNYISGQGLGENLLILLIIMMLFLILHEKPKYHILSFLMAGFCWWIKLEAFYAIIAILVIYLVVHRNQKNTLRNFIPFLLILLLVISPIFIQRDLQFDDPFYFWYNDTILLDNYTELLSNPKMNDEAGTIPEIQSQGILEKIPNGILNLFTGISRISFPYLFLLIPFGILFSLRPIDQKISRIKSTWALILTIIGVLIIPFSIIDERRFLFVLFPFLILLSTIPIQRVTEYGLSTFHLDDRKKTNFLIIVIMIILLLSITFTTGITGFGYGLPKTDFENEKLLFTQSFYENFDGRLLRDVDVTDYLAYVSLTNENTSLKDVQSPREKNPYPDLYEPGKVVWLSVSGNSIEQLILNGELRSLNYIAITEYGSYYYPFLNSLYENEEKYSFLEKIVDTNEIGFTHFKIKVFEIDYKKFHELNE